MPRLPSIVERPAGLVYEPEFLSEDEERTLLEAVEHMDFAEVRMHGQAAKRTVKHFGLRYDYQSSKLTPVEPWPLEWLRERAGRLAGIEPERFVEALVTRYPPGAGIGWHRDALRFGSIVVGVSLGSVCTMRFQRRSAGDGVRATHAGVRRTYALALAPRSAYLLTGSARWAWQHSIPAAKGLRYSVTFRTLRAASETVGDGA